MNALKISSIKNIWLSGQFLLTASYSVILVVAALAVILFESNLKTAVLDATQVSLHETGSRINNQIQEKLAKYSNDLRFLFATPPVSGLVRTKSTQGFDSLDNTTYEQWIRRFEIISTAFLESNSEYEQIRIISADPAGMELLRVERSNGRIRTLQDIHLQSKKHTDYFMSSTQLSNGELYMSPISLNREFGKIEFPYRPMIRLSLPIFDDKMHRFGFLIVNINAARLLESVTDMVLHSSQLILTDSEGYFLLHPDTELMFSRDLAPDKTWEALYGSVTQGNKLLHPFASKNTNNIQGYYETTKIVTSGDTDKGFLLANVITPILSIDADANTRRQNVYTFLVILLVVLFIILGIFSRSIRKNSELAETRALSEAIIGGSKDAIISLEHNGNISSWNSAARDLFGMEEQQVLGEKLSSLSLFTDIDLEEVTSVLSNGVQQQTLETHVKAADQKTHHLSLSLSSIVDQYMQVSGVAIIIRDVTIEKEADDKIRQANAKLEVKVAERTAALQKSSDIKSAFISNISHEMRTPLNGIIGTLNLVKKEPLSEQQNRYLEMTEVSVNSLAVLINDILDLSKIEAGKLDLDFKEFNPVKLIESLCATMAVKAQEKGLELILDVVDTECASIFIDPQRLSQILINLINNAIKFTPSGFIKVRAYSELTNGSDMVLHCEVSDSGIGIAKENQEKLFSAFTQAEKSTASKYGGTGLGLSICKQLASLMNGQITFVSQKGVGSTFHLQLTLAQDDVTFMTHKPRLMGKNVLILVDNGVLRENIEHTVMTLGGKVVAHNGVNDWFSNIEENSKTQADILVLDQQDSGLSQLDEHWPFLTSHSRAPEKVIVLTNNVQPNSQVQHFVPKFVSKPVLLSEFLNIILDQRTAIDEENAHTRRGSDIKQTSEVTNLHGATVLVVDDNDINIEVAIGALSGLSLNFERARNGQEAIEKLIHAEQEGISIHCILMDCQMPVLDGYSATRQIRNGAGGENIKNVPIIAMTANAMMGEREQCLDAGMNDYVTKPITAENLITKMTNLILSVYTPHTNVTEQSSKPIDNNPAEPVVWNKNDALLRLSNNQELLSKICALFIESAPEKISNLHQAAPIKDFESIRTISHYLKGAAASLGATSLQNDFQFLEKSAEAQNIVDIEKKLTLIDEHYEHLVVLLNAELAMSQ